MNEGLGYGLPFAPAILSVYGARAELEDLLTLDRVTLEATHDRVCPLTSRGKNHGPCNCPSGLLSSRIVRVLQFYGRAEECCGAPIGAHYVVCKKGKEKA